MPHLYFLTLLERDGVPPKSIEQDAVRDRARGTIGVISDVEDDVAVTHSVLRSLSNNCVIKLPRNDSRAASEHEVGQVFALCAVVV
jgi:hypothetical protein